MQLIKMMTITLMVMLIMPLQSCATKKQPILELIKAGQDLAYHPINEQEERMNRQMAYNQPISLDDLATARLRQKMIDVSDKIWETIGNQQRLTIIREKGLEGEILKMFQLLQSDVFAIDSRISRSNILRTIKEVTAKIDTEEGQEWRESWGQFQTLTGKITFYYSLLDEYMTSSLRSRDKITRLAIEDYAKSIIQPGSTGDTAIQKTLGMFHHLIMPSPPRYKNQTSNLAALYKFRRVLLVKNGINLCNLGQSPHQLLYNLYNVIALTEIKGYAMVQFSYMMLKLYGMGNFTVESELARETFKQQASEKLVAVKDVLGHMDTMYWRCDPQNWSLGTNYIKLTRLLQGHIENEVDMNDISTCRHSCSTYDVTEPKSCYKNLLCAKQRKCQGRLFDCQFYHADAWVCLSNDPQRRYDWIEYEDGRILGTKGQCSNKIKVDSWWRWVFYHCSYCLCKCDSPGPDSDRYWSLREATSNMNKNFLVTGVRFVKKNRVIHLEVEQARSLAEGAVDEQSRVWLESQPIDVNNGNDFMNMTYEQRAIDLDRVTVPAGHVVTGIRFRNLGGHLNLEVRATPVKFKEGTLLPDQSVWMGNDNTPATQQRRVHIHVVLPDVPTKFKGHSTIDSSTNQYIQFDTTAAAKDVMQTTVPFIDSQIVSPTTGTWLSGVGLYHKGSLGYGGYVGLSVSTFDFTKHLLPTNEQKARFSRQELKSANEI